MQFSKQWNTRKYVESSSKIEDASQKVQETGKSKVG